MNGQYLDPALLGDYPPSCKEIFGDAWPEWPAEDFALIKQKLDFIGINYYTRSVTQANDSYPLKAGAVRQPLGTYTETGWEVFPQGLADLLVWAKDRYGNIPTYITENGAAFFDPPVAEDDRVRDPLRIDYLHKHLRAIHEAIDAGLRHPRLHGVVAARQPGMVARLLQALRHRARELRHPEAHAEGQRALVLRR